MIVDSGCSYVIVGHSERRQFFGETNQSVNQKVKAALESGLVPIVCVGEMLEDRESGKTKKVVTNQLVDGIDGLSKTDILRTIIAYEPVWSIGTGIIPKSDDLFKTISFIKKEKKNYKVLYGGSVNPKNINQLKSINNIDGYLIGGASQDPKKFIDIIKKTYN